MRVCRRYTTLSSLRQGRWVQSSIGCLAIASVAFPLLTLFHPRDRACVCVSRALPRALASQAILPAASMRPGRLLSVSTTAESTAAAESAGGGNLTPSRSQNRAYASRSTRLVASMQPCPAAGRPYKLFPLKVVGPIGLPWTPRPLGSTRITELPSYYEAVRPCALRSVLYLSLVHNLRISHHGRASSSKPTTPIAGRVPRGQPSSFRVTGSPVPHQSPSQARAAFMPDAVWAVSRCLPDCSRERNPTLGFDVV